MPRTRRAAAPDTSAADEAQRDPQAAPAAPPASESADTAAKTPPRPRRRRTPPDENASAADASPALPDAAAPSPGDSDASPPVKRRGGRRTKTAAPPADAEAAPAPPEAPAPVTAEAAPDAAPPAARRGRGRRAATTPPSPVDDTSPTDAAPAPTQADTPPSPDEGAARPARSRRRRATPTAETPVAAPIDMEAPVTDDASAPAAPPGEEVPPRRGRGRRRRGEAAAPVDTAPPDPALPDAEGADAEAPATEEDGARRGRRRSRRRRRGGDMESADDVVEGDLLLDGDADISADADDLGLDLPLAAVSVPVYIAPPLVPPVQAPADGSPLPRVTTRVARPESGRGLPQIVVDDEPHPPFFFFVNAETADSGDVVDAQIKAAGEAGIHLYSGVMYLPLKNAYGDRSFGATDALLQQILDADPQARILPRLQCVPTNYWARTHPDQMARYADGSEGDVSLASTEFWADCVDALDALIAHLSDPATPGGDRVIGFHLDRGEWFYDREAGYDYSPPNLEAFRSWLHAKYQQTYALRAAWFQGSVTFEDATIPAWTAPTGRPDPNPVYSSARDGRWPDYAQFASELVAQAITGLAEAVKTLSEGRLLVAVSYGYTLEFATRNDSGHLALGALLQSPHIDILAGPNSYTSRAAGSPASFGAPIDSVALHGKLWLVEDDTKTFLAQPDSEDTYNPHIVGGADTQAAHQRHFGAALAHGAGVTWMDLWGQGWLNSPDIWRELGGLRDQAGRMGQIAGAETAPDVAVLVDEASLAYLKSNPAGLGLSLVGRTRDLLLRAGASVGFYLQSDVEQDNFPDARLYLFLNALRVTSAERMAIREKLQRPGKTLAWLYAAGLFDEGGVAETEISETVGMTLRLQPWNSRVGSQITEARHPITERLRGGKKIVGQDEIINPSYAVADPQAAVLAEYTGNGAASLAVREHPGGWKSVFFGDPHLTVELLRGLFTYAGVPLYDTQDDVTYAGTNGVLLVHSAFTGQRTLTLPRASTVYDAMEDRIIATNTRSFRSFLRSRTTRLFLWGDAEAVSSATGLAAPVAEPPAPADDADAPPAPSSPEDAALPPARPRQDAAAAEAAAAEELSSLVAAILAPPSSSGHPRSEAFDDDDPLFDAVTGDADMDALAEGEDNASADSDASGEAAPSAPRSRWQRRRAALRARREAERQAQQSPPPDASDSGASAPPPVDMAELMPGLPPRRVPPPPSAPETGDRSPSDGEG